MSAAAIQAFCGSPVGARSSGCLQAKAQQPRLAAARVARRHRLRPLATAEKQGTQQQEGKPQVPDTPPAPTGAGQRLQQPADEASSQQAEPAVTIEDIQQRAAMMRQQKQAGEAKDGLVEGVMEEVGLIKWPAPLTAVFNTFLVIGIVAGTAALLLAINGLLTEVTDLIY